ncbi:MAG: hypothetical protein JNM70_00315 [Anaerolineae bacterium]|nr:hypothetical protein [Anaerolineae bacterium]
MSKRIIQQFVAKIVVKEGTGTLYYTFPFPFPDDRFMPGYGNLDLRGSVPMTRHMLRFDIPLSGSTESDLRNPDKEQLRAYVATMREWGLSYRQIADAIGLHWTRVAQMLAKAGK